MSPALAGRDMTDFTTHFDDAAWHSFVRGILPASDSQPMREHLDRGCAECQRSYEAWRRFADTASRQGSSAIADSADSFAMALFELRRKIPFRAGMALLAERVFDSLQEPAPMGIRGSASASRQLVYEAGGYLIDLQLEQRSGGSGALTGQVVHAWTEGATCGAGVVLVHENSVVGQTVANSIGEFQFHCDCRDNLKICVGTSDETFIEVPIPDARSSLLAAGSAKEPINGDWEYCKKSN
jgi:hypothetical protein